MFQKGLDNINKQAIGHWEAAINSKQKNAKDKYHEKNGCTQVAFRPKSDALSEVWSGQQWVPDVLRHHSLTPIDLSLKGSIQIVRQETYHMPFNNEDLSMVGVGKFIIGYECNCIVLQWPMASLSAIDIRAEDVMDFWQDSVKKQLASWSEGNMVHCQMCNGDVVWVPYGYQCAVLSLEWNGTPNTLNQVPVGLTQSPHCYMVFNYVCKSLWDNVDPQAQFSIIDQQNTYVKSLGLIDSARKPGCAHDIAKTVSILEWLISTYRGKPSAAWHLIANDDDDDAAVSDNKSGPRTRHQAQPIQDSASSAPARALSLTNVNASMASVASGSQTLQESSAIDTD